MTFDTEVLVIGAGPVGLMLSNLLGTYGQSVTLVEALPDLIDYPRGVGIDDESLRTIQAVGLSEAVLPHTTPQHVMRMVSGRGTVLAETSPTTDEFGWSRRNGFIQPLVDRALLEGLDAHASVDVRFNHRVVALEETAEGVLATVEVTDADGEARTTSIHARYVVGCEGGRSATRQWMGVRFEGKSPSTRWLVIDVRNDPLGTPNVFLGADPKRPYVSIGLPHAIRRFEFMLFEHERDDIVEDQAFVEGLLADHVPDATALEFIRKRTYTHHGRIASNFRKGRVLIAGDAAHLMPVWMGQGWNSGMRDATNLAWKLATILRGQAGDELLDSYDAERRDHVQSMIDLSLTVGSVLKPTNRLVAAGRDALAAGLNLFPQVKAYVTEMRFKPMPRYTRGVVVDPGTRVAGSAAAELTGKLVPIRSANSSVSPVGTQFPQPRVTTGLHSDVRLDDVIGNWWSVLVWGNDPTDVFTARQLDSLRALGAQLVCLVPETQLRWAERPDSDVVYVGDRTGRLKAWFDDRPFPVVFVRPDRFVAGACLAQDAGATLAAVLTALSSTQGATDGAPDRLQVA
jgi:3-(3-hydroxy-phenyl)propionate hydroxylase